MSSIVQPTESQLDTLVAPYLVRQQMGLGFALGYASPEFTPPGNLYFAGNVQNQFGGRLRLDGDTLFELASISKPSQQRCMPCWSAAFLRPKQLATTVERDPAADHHRLARRPALNDPPSSLWSGTSRRQRRETFSQERNRWFESDPSSGESTNFRSPARARRPFHSRSDWRCRFHSFSIESASGRSRPRLPSPPRSPWLPSASCPCSGSSRLA